MSDNLIEQLQHIGSQVQPDVSWAAGAKAGILGKIASLPPGSENFLIDQASGWTIQQIVVTIVGGAAAMTGGLYVATHAPAELPSDLSAAVAEILEFGSENEDNEKDREGAQGEVHDSNGWLPGGKVEGTSDSQVQNVNAISVENTAASNNTNTSGGTNGGGGGGSSSSGGNSSGANSSTTPGTTTPPEIDPEPEPDPEDPGGGTATTTKKGLQVGKVEETPKESTLPWGKRDDTENIEQQTQEKNGGKNLE